MKNNKIVFPKNTKLKLKSTRRCDCCREANNEGLFYLIEVKGMWQTKMNGLTTDPNHFDLIKMKVKSDAETICDILNFTIPIFQHERKVTEHLYLTP